jgi:hypothetical protein
MGLVYAEKGLGAMQLLTLCLRGVALLRNKFSLSKIAFG